jgi:FlaA1/EpsC-like NDP-sugar epimerase
LYAQGSQDGVENTYEVIKEKQPDPDYLSSPEPCRLIRCRFTEGLFDRIGTAAGRRFWMEKNKGNYWRFAAMIATSTIVMFCLTYLNTYEPGHIYWSETRFYMALLMGAAMAIVMLSYMSGMYKNRMLNIGIYFASTVVFLLALWLVRSQTTIEDQSWMRAMIPHHSIAILTSERAGIKDIRVRKLADSIIDAQRREIGEMAWLFNDIAKNGAAVTGVEAASRQVPVVNAGKEGH